MALRRGIDGSDPLRAEALTRAGEIREERRTAAAWRLGAGTLACPRCDAPVTLPGSRATPADPLDCPFCAHSAATRDFLSLAAPARPARVQVRVTPAAPTGRSARSG